MTTTSSPARPIDVRRVSRLLVALDGTPYSAGALTVAAAFGLRLGVPVGAIDCLLPGIRPEREELWVRHELRAAGIDPQDDTPVHATGIVVEDILATAAEVPGTVVCMASHGRTAVGELVFGSTTHDVIVASPAPVLVVGPETRVPAAFDTVQVCVEGSHADQPIVDVATEWASRLGAVPWLTQVVEPPSAEGAALPVGDVVEGAVLGRLAGRMRAAGLEPEWDVLHGHRAGPPLAAWSVEHAPALVVAGSHGRSSTQRLALGSVSSFLVHELTSPLLVVGPAARS